MILRLKPVGLTPILVSETLLQFRLFVLKSTQSRKLNQLCHWKKRKEKKKHLVNWGPGGIFESRIPVASATDSLPLFSHEAITIFVFVFCSWRDLRRTAVRLHRKAVQLAHGVLRARVPADAHAASQDPLAQVRVPVRVHQEETAVNNEHSPSNEYCTHRVSVQPPRKKAERF